MNLQEIFKNISEQLNLDFKNSKQINHNGNKGDYREGQLYKFLSEKLPKKYGIGCGEIISSCKQVSKQSDIVIYNQIDSVPLFASFTVQVFPIESVYGIIEVKSELSKEKLLEGLNNIKSVKSLTMATNYRRILDQGITVTAKRSRPFGIIFAYSLAKNSLQSLEQNLREWEAENQKEDYCNLIIVLNEGIIYHYGNIDHNRCVINEDIYQYSFGTIALHFKDDALFHFYSILLDLCSNTFLGSYNLMDYFKPYEKINDLIVRNHDKFIGTGLNDGKNFKLTKEVIKKIYNYCKTQSKITQSELMSKISSGVSVVGLEGSNFLNQEIYLYNPDDLKGLTNLDSQISTDDRGRVYMIERNLVPWIYIKINNEAYYVPQCYITENDTEEVKE